MVHLPERDYDLPDIDILTLLLESPLTWLKDDHVAHAEAAQPDNFITKAQARTSTRRLAHVFRNRFGVGANNAGQDVVVCMSTGQVLVPTIFYGVVAAGGVYSAASSTYTSSELARQIKQGPSNLLIVSEDCVEVGIQAAKECRLPLHRVLVLQSMGGRRNLTEVTGKGQNLLEETAELDWERVTDPKILTERAVCLLYSSGTTGQPKGVHFCHRNLTSAGLLSQLVNREFFTRRKARDPSWTHNYRTLGHLPVGHIAGVQSYFINASVAGGPVYWMPKFDFSKFLEYNKKFRITHLFTVPSIYLLIAKSPLVTDQLASLEQTTSGAAPLGAEVKIAAETRMGCAIGQSWGLSETTGSVTYMPWDQHDSTSSIGPVIPNARLRIIDENEKDVSDGQEGEFAVKGPMVVRGYWKNEKATRETFTKDGQGWLKTGDIGVYKNGRFTSSTGKRPNKTSTHPQEMIKYKGFQIAPAELESHLFSHSLILDAAVIGVPAPDIKRFVGEGLADYNQLRGGVVYVDVIPKGPSGKILRRILRERARGEARTKL